MVRLVNAIMGEALHSRASDIHIEPQERDVRVRIKLDRLEADTRVSSMPTMHGETVVIRLLRKETETA